MRCRGPGVCPTPRPPIPPNTQFLGAADSSALSSGTYNSPPNNVLGANAAPLGRSPARGAAGPCSAGVQEDPSVAAPSGAARAELGAFSAPRGAADRPWDRPPQPRTRRAQRGDLRALRQDARRHRDTRPQLSRAFEPPLREENEHKEMS